MGNESARNIKWIEGLRGLASFLVVLTHLARGWDYKLFYPQDSEDAAPRILQLPILRIPWQGRIGVTIFALLTGFVCALKPLRLSNSGQKYAAFSAIAKSAFRRPPRLVFPATIAMTIAWVAAQLGAFTVSSRCDSWWMRYSSPELAPTLTGEIMSYFRNFLTVWTNGWMAYDDHQWALLPLLQGAMTIYVSLCATMFVRFRYRMIFYVIMMLYYHQDREPKTETFGLQFFYGMFLCDLSQHPPWQVFLERHKRRLNILAPFLIIFGLLIGSYPGENAEWSGWSRFLTDISPYFIPTGTDLGRRYSAFAVMFIAFGIFISPTLRDLLSNRWFLWLGKHSFAVYLIHGTLLRTVFCWMVYGISGQPFTPPASEDDEEPVWLPRRPGWWILTAIPIWLCLVYACAWAWMRYVDTACANATQWLESWVFEEEGEKSLPLHEQAPTRHALAEHEREHVHPHPHAPGREGHVV